MDEHRKTLHLRLTSPPCQEDLWFAKQRDNKNHRLYLVDTSLETFRPWGLIDDTALRTCRVGSGQDVAEKLALRKKVPVIFNRHSIGKSNYMCYTIILISIVTNLTHVILFYYL